MSAMCTIAVTWNVDVFAVDGIIREWQLLLALAILLLGLAEGGFRLGQRLHSTKELSRTQQVAAIQGAVLGLLSLLLGFTFGMALDRYEERRRLVLKEANRIGTTYLRVSFLPPPQQDRVKQLLRRYVEVRIEGQMVAEDPRKLEAAVRESFSIHRELWKEAADAANIAPTTITRAFVDTLNEMIDTSAERIAAARARIPGGVWLLLLIVASFGALITGYAAGVDGERTIFGSLLLQLLNTIVIVLVFDLSQPLQGIIGVSQQPMLDLRQLLLY